MKFLEVMFLFFILNQDIFKRGRCKLRRLRIGAPEDSGIFHFAYGQKYQVSFKYSQLNHLSKACRISPLINCGLPWLQRIQSKSVRIIRIGCDGMHKNGEITRGFRRNDPQFSNRQTCWRIHTKN